MFEGTNLRTLGRLDSLFYSYYKKESEETAKEMVLEYLKEIDTLKAPSNIPFAIGGTDKDGNSLINELSYIFLEAYKIAKTNNTKFHILCTDDTPADIIESAFEGVRDGNNSIVFMSDRKIIESLKKIGIEHNDAVNYHVVGCYECGGEGELTSSCNARVNLPLALEFALNNGRNFLDEKLAGLENKGEFETFESLYTEYKRQLVYMCNCAMKMTDICEAHYKHVHSAPILSGAYISALEKGGDLYGDYTAKYNNSSVNGIGLATAVDSLVAIKKLVYEDKTLTLEKLIEILKSNWENQEPLRLMIKRKFPKFGLNDEATDEIAKDIVDVMYQTIGGKPNVKGGIYRLGLFSINWRWEFGEKTGASADGRLAGETLSQNASATFGADKDGATAHLLSVTSIDASQTPNGTIADIDIHSSAVKGKNGIKALTSTLKTYFDLGGFGVHYNVLDTEILKDAKLNPEKYPNLQVRLCGWNVLFSSLSEKEKDEFIARSVR
jgi:formate C-acetyltransferase